ncbi:hypothetical protein PRK78_006630 [Emydomyces testavorans]|uniref:AAA+ ATPase domain-containing protein n=1 Tax=Emydomyces testavorans TaxID=2070801 RepID=A0AAF0DLR0_9EURO|nr:hypothetical protein PRK78_006630 [Emydomyces testavorans]
MATVQLNAMGQHDQRTLHPFFMKLGRDPVVERPQLANTQFKQLNDRSLSEAADVGLQSTARNRPGRIDEDDDLSRRKRRKTTSPVCLGDTVHAPGLSSAAAVEPESVTSVSNVAVPSPSNDIEERPGKTRYSFRKGTVNSGPAKVVCENHLESGLRETPRKGKILQLNRNGKLLSSPIQHADANVRENGGETRKRGRPRKKREPEIDPLSKVAIMKYGSGKLPQHYIGGAIHEIMNGHTTYALIKQRTVKAQQPQGPPKPTHPFFLNRKPPKMMEHAQAQQECHAQKSTDTVLDKPKPSILELSRPHFAAATMRIPSSSKAVKPRRANDPVEPIWPPHDMVHIYDGVQRPVLERREHTSFEQRKAKGLATKISEPETILPILSQSIREGCADLQDLPANTPLRYPSRIIKEGHSLRELITGKLSQGLGKRQTELRTDKSAHNESLHPAVTSLLSSLPTARSSFETGTYEELPWIQKYAPDLATKVLQVGSEALVLRSWLQRLTVSAVNTVAGKLDSKSSRAPKAEFKKRTKRKRPKDLDDFIASSSDEEPHMDELTDDEDELAGAVTVPRRAVVRAGGSLSPNNAKNERQSFSNTILLSGPPGCGKTAAVYAVARELDFDIFEINAGCRRSARDVIERVGDMAQNHLVQMLKQIDNNTSVHSGNGINILQQNDKQTSISNLFKEKPLPNTTASKAGTAPPPSRSCEVQKSRTSQRQSLIFLEEVDILFSEDKQFWNGVLALIAQSKRPIVMTCNDESLVPRDSLSFHAILRFCPPPPDLAAGYLFVLCANEGHIVEPKAIRDLYTVLGKDLRATIMQLDYWCQMAVGSQKSGLDWIVDRPRSDRLGTSPDLPRIISSGTYLEGMGWLCRDMAVAEGDGIQKRIQLVTELLTQWHISAVDWLEPKRSLDSCSSGNSLESLEQASFVSDMKSALDLLGKGIRSDPTKDTLDTSFPPTPEKQRLNYIEGYQFLEADPQPDYVGLLDRISITLGVLLEETSSQLPQQEYEQDIIDQILQRATNPSPTMIQPSYFTDAFRPIFDVSDYSTPASGHRPLSFEHGTPVISEDVAPYIRFIVASDLRIEQQRHQLNSLLSQSVPGAKRMRTTRASRAALEGGNNAMARRERWFSGKVVPAQVMATGGLGWENILLLHLRRPKEEWPMNRTDEALDNTSNGSNEHGS